MCPRTGREVWVRKKLSVIIRLLILAVWAMVLLIPAAFVVTGSVMSSQELSEYLGPALGQKDGYISWRLIPRYPTPEHYIKALFYSPQFMTVFWNSVKLTGLIAAGQLMVGVPAAWAFAIYRFRGSRMLFHGYVALMLMPFQVTMLSQYLVLDKLGMMNTHLAVILPAAFSTFPVFLIYRGFCRIPRGLLEAARVDGAGEGYLFLKIGLPLSSGGILSAVVLGLLEYWNMLEQPMAFLTDKTLWPLSLFLPEIGLERAGFAFAGSAIMLIPAVFVFLLGRDYLEQGIVAAALKE